MKLFELNMPIARSDAFLLLDSFRKFMSSIDSAYCWRIDDVSDEDRRLHLNPDDPFCRVKMIDPATGDVFVYLSIMFRSRKNGVSELFLGNIVASRKLNMHAISDVLYNQIAAKFFSEIWKPFLQKNSHNQCN